MRIFWLLSLIITGITSNAFAQENPLPNLIREREQLFQDYQYFQNQNSNFWGKKSKKDLLNIIATTEKIIQKDSEIIREVNRQAIIKQARIAADAGKVKSQVIDDNRLHQDNLYQLRQDLSAAQNREKVLRRDLQRLREQLEEDRQRRQHADVLLALAGGACLLLLLYAFGLRRHLHRVKRTGSKGKKS